MAALLALASAASPARAVELSDATPLAGPARVFHPFPIASIDHALATAVNPAGLAGRASADFFLLFTDADEIRDGDAAVLLKMRELGLAFERFDPLADRAAVSRLTVALGQRITRSIAAGVSYAWFFSEDDDLAALSSLDLGLRVRASSRLMLAAAAYGYNEPDLGAAKIPRHYVAGASAAPLTSWLGLFVEGAMTAEQSLRDATGAYGAEIEPVAGIIVRGRADTDGDFRVGFEYNYNQTAYGIIGLYRQGGDSDGRAGYLRLVDTPYARR